MSVFRIKNQRGLARTIGAPDASPYSTVDVDGLVVYPRDIDAIAPPLGRRWHCRPTTGALAGEFSGVSVEHSRDSGIWVDAFVDQNCSIILAPPIAFGGSANNQFDDGGTPQGASISYEEQSAASSNPGGELGAGAGSITVLQGTNAGPVLGSIGFAAASSRISDRVGDRIWIPKNWYFALAGTVVNTSFSCNLMLWWGDSD